MTGDVSRDYHVAEIELVYRPEKKTDPPCIVKTSRAAFQLLRHYWDANKIELLEESKLLLLNHNKSCIGITHLATGGITSCVVDPRLVFATALKARATGFILAHNHPSGNLSPSQMDIYLTDKLYNGAKLLELEFCDHLIITPHDFYSMADRGHIP